MHTDQTVRHLLQSGIERHTSERHEIESRGQNSQKHEKHFSSGEQKILVQSFGSIPFFMDKKCTLSKIFRVQMHPYFYVPYASFEQIFFSGSNIDNCRYSGKPYRPYI